MVCIVDPEVSMTIVSRLIIYLYIHVNNVDLEYVHRFNYMTDRDIVTGRDIVTYVTYVTS